MSQQNKHIKSINTYVYYDNGICLVFGSLKALSNKMSINYDTLIYHFTRLKRDYMKYNRVFIFKRRLIRSEA